MLPAWHYAMCPSESGSAPGDTALWSLMDMACIPMRHGLLECGTGLGSLRAAAGRLSSGLSAGRPESAIMNTGQRSQFASLLFICLHPMPRMTGTEWCAV